MDEFLRDVNSLLYMKWISCMHYDHIKISGDHHELVLDNRFSRGSVILYPENIIEEEVVDKESNEVIFYIHFQMANMKHAKDLFEEMLDCINENSHQPLAKILLCCSGGLTTTLYAEKMSELATLEKLNYGIDATGFATLYEIGHDYDLILLAPQVSYLLPDARRHIPDAIVETIPTKYFARNDFHQTLQFALELLRKEKTA